MSDSVTARTIAKRFMRGIIVPILLSTVLSPAKVLGQQPSEGQHDRRFPAKELFIGFSYANLDLASQASVFAPTVRNYYGMHFALRLNLNRSIAVLCDLAGQRGGTDRLSPLGYETKAILGIAQGLCGFEFTMRGQRLQPFSHALMGVTYAAISVPGRIDSRYGDHLGLTENATLADRTNLGLGVGGGLDVILTPGLALRLFQADFIPTQMDDGWQSLSRLSTGLVFRW